WAASAPAQAAAVAALGGEADAHLASTIPRLREERARLEGACATLGIETVPSDTHYFLARVPGAPGVHQRLRTEFGIKVRHCASFGLPGHLRMAARTPAENDLLIAALEAVCCV
ncbi:MAG: aminotransferase class I/II-fold pyridoxal phosphate-dependent enzyme, partial [Gemmatimonadetes bacterium]|nr:aminotransferase class I/II-fold pyridoxal phosphate-dependent enzyme [Gemmatimonadota bacterium]